MAIVTGYSYLCAADGRIELVLQAMSTIVSHGKSLPVSISRQISHSVDKLTAAKGNLLVPGESTDMVTGNVRFLSSCGFLSQAISTTYSAPQTLLEVFVNAPPTSMSFSHEALKHTVQTSSIAVSSPYNRASNRVLQSGFGSSIGDGDGGDGAIAQVSVSQTTVNFLTGRSPNTTATKVTLSFDSDPGVSIVVYSIPSRFPILYFDVTPQNGSVSCKRTGYQYSASANCSLAPNINVTCSGNDTRVIKYTCPGIKLIPLCLAWNGEDYVSTDACTALSYTPLNTTCVCVGNTGYDEALGEPANNNPQIDNIAATADLEVSAFVDTWVSAKDISPSTLTKNKVSSRI